MSRRVRHFVEPDLACCLVRARARDVGRRSGGETAYDEYAVDA
jgi:hypothetical protein